MEFSNQVISLLVLSSPAISYHIEGALGSPYVVVILRYYYLIMQYEKSKENLNILKSQSVLNEYLTLPYTQKLFMSINFRHLLLLEVANFKCC